MVKSLAFAVDPVDTILDGDGSQKKPWTRRKEVPPVLPPPPRLLNIDDDPEGYFSSSPLSPVDHAVIFSSLHEAGHRVLGVGHILAWEESEPLAMDALRKQLDRFDAAVLALPLARGAVPEPVAAPFLRWSVPESDALGNVSALPQVNRIAVANAEQGGSRSLAGFSLLENESDPGADVQPLLAKWGDRIVFAFPLAVEIAAEGLSPADVIVHVGKEIRMGKAGQVIDIDGFGRGRVAPGVEAIEAPAKRIVSEGAEGPKSKPLLTRDTRNELSAADKAWSDQLAGRIQALRSAPRFEPSVELPRPDPLFELLLVSLLALAATLAAGLRNLPWRIISSLMVAGFACQLLYLFADRQNAWFPPLAMLSPGLIGLALSFRKGEACPVLMPTPAPQVEADAPPATVEKPLPPPEAPQTPDPVPESSPQPEQIPAHREESPSESFPEPVASPVQEIVELGFPAEYAWDPVPAVRSDPNPPAAPETAPETPETIPEPAARNPAKKSARKTPAKKAARKSPRKAARKRSGEDSPSTE
jgi:hypothetical protein